MQGLADGRTSSSSSSTRTPLRHLAHNLHLVGLPRPIPRLFSPRKRKTCLQAASDGENSVPGPINGQRDISRYAIRIYAAICSYELTVSSGAVAYSRLAARRLLLIFPSDIGVRLRSTPGPRLYLVVRICRAKTRSGILSLGKNLTRVRRLAECPSSWKVLDNNHPRPYRSAPTVRLRTSG